MTKLNVGNIEVVPAQQSGQVGQLIYTSFRQSGFTLLQSVDVPLSAQKVFLNQLAQSYWDTYFPPKPGHRAAYLHELPLTTPGTLFGWLYHDGQDELGRSDVPYFIAYYLPHSLQAAQLSQILACLQQGPVEWFDRLKPPPQTLQSFSLAKLQNYNPARLGVELPAKLRVESYRTLESQSLLNWFYAEPEATKQLTHCSDPPHAAINPLQSTQEPVTPSQSALETMNISNLILILNQLVAKSGIQGAALVSSEGQAIVMPIGLEENTVGILAGTMLCLLKSTQEELQWQAIETVSVRSQTGHLILRNCGTEAYLLIKADKIPLGLLDGEVSRAVDKLRVELEEALTTDAPATNESKAMVSLPQSAPLSNSMVEESNSSAPLNSANEVHSSNEITYRGRRVNL